MKIAIAAPIEEPVPPQKYGGIERVVYYLAEELVAGGHTVTLFASGDSKTSAELVPVFERAIRVLPECKDMMVREAYKLMSIGDVVKAINQNGFDIVHNHIDWNLLAFQQFVEPPIVTTLHGPMSSPLEQAVYSKYSESQFISISHSQRETFPGLNYVGNVYNGIDPDEFELSESHDDYLAFLGRISSEKGIVQAIEIAQKTNNRLRIGAKVDPNDQDFYEKEVEPLIDGEQIEFLGEVDHEQKVDLLGQAKGLLAPIQWDEPFGMYFLESLACGTPVITINRGSVPEILNDEVSLICESASEIADRLDEVETIDPATCREYMKNNFSAQLMAEEYLKVYEKIANQ